MMLPNDFLLWDFFGYEQFLFFILLWVFLFIGTIHQLKGYKWIHKIVIASISVLSASYLYELPDHIKLILVEYFNGTFRWNMITTELIILYQVIVFFSIVYVKHGFGRNQVILLIPVATMNIITYSVAYTVGWYHIGINWYIPIFLLRLSHVVLNLSIARRMSKYG